MAFLGQTRKSPRLIRSSGTVPMFAWYLIFVSVGMIVLAIALKPAAVEDEFAHVADSDLESFLAPAAGGNRDGDAGHERSFSLREKMRQRLERSRDR